jgi:hypothetical protein
MGLEPTTVVYSPSSWHRCRICYPLKFSPSPDSLNVEEMDRRVTRLDCGKNRPKCNPTHFLSNLVHNFYRGTKKPKIWATYLILAKIHYRSIGENSTNLVTLMGSIFENKCHFVATVNFATEVFDHRQHFFRSIDHLAVSLGDFC